MKIIKRSGQEVDFNPEKIKSAISRANLEVKETERATDKEIEQMTDNVVELCEKSTYILNVEDIQELVETEIMNNRKFDLAKVYIRYRYKHSLARKVSPMDSQILSLVNLDNEELKTENSNKNPVIVSTQRDYIAGEVSKDISKRLLLPEKLVKAHEEGIIHIHDLDYYIQDVHNCVDGRSWIYYKDSDGIHYIQINELQDKYNYDITRDGQTFIPEDKTYILSRNGWSRIKAFNVRETKRHEKSYTVHPKCGLPLTMTGKHRVPVIRDGIETVVDAEELKVGDTLLTIKDLYIDIRNESFNGKYVNLVEFCIDRCIDAKICNTKKLDKYIQYKYNTSLWELLKKIGVNYQHSKKNMDVAVLDYLLNNIEIPFDVLMSMRIKCKHSKYSLPIFIPLSPKLAKLFGYIYADGGVYVNESQSTYQVTFTNTNEHMIDDFINAFEDVFEIRLSKIYPTETSTSPCIRSTCGSRILVELFKNFDDSHFNGSGDMRIPKFIITGDEDIKLAFLSASFDCDGYLSDTSIGYTTACEEYCDQFHEILTSLGYHPRKKIINARGSEYNFKNMSGTRNYNNYVLSINRNDEKHDLYERMNTIKENTSYYQTKDAIYNTKTNFDEIIAITESDNTITVYDFQTEDHWFIANDIIVHNCSLVNLEDMLQNGTVISGKKIDSPKTFSTACNIATQIIAKVASSQFGGQTITLAHLAPFVQRSRDKFRKKVREEYAAIGLHLSDEQINTIAEMRVNDDIERGIQTMQYQILTLMTCNGQAPFVTVFMYLNEVEDPQTRKDLKTIIKEVLRQRMIGVKNEKGVYVTPSFPKLIYVTDEDNIWEGTPDFDVTMMAAQCSAKRMVPDYISAKKCKELKDGNVFPCMGCVDGDEVITYKLLNNLYVESFSRMWNRVSLLFKVKLQHKGDPHLYMDVEGVEIYDKENGFVEVKRVIKNLSSDWVRITFSNGRMLQCTTDHPLPVVGKGRTFVRDLNIGDRVPLVKSQFTDESFEMDQEFAWALGVIVCDGCYDRQMNVTIAMEGEDEIADALESILKKVYGSEMILKEWHRGKKGDYKELRFSNRIRMEQDMKELFGGTPKKERQIPNVIFRTNLETRLSFLGGLIDADGYINASGTISTIQLGSTNKELALQQMMLMQSCGINARMYKNYYKKGSSKIRYRVEGDAIPELAQYIKCEKKRNNIENTERTNKSNVTNDDASIISIEYLDGVIDWSYDVTTESDYFDVSGIYSHNCRSFLHPWYDENGKPKFYGRFNQGKLVMPL